MITELNFAADPGLLRLANANDVDAGCGAPMSPTTSDTGGR